MEKTAFVNSNKFCENGWTYLNSWDIMRKVYENVQFFNGKQWTDIAAADRNIII